MARNQQDNWSNHGHLDHDNCLHIISRTIRFLDFLLIVDVLRNRTGLKFDIVSLYRRWNCDHQETKINGSNFDGREEIPCRKQRSGRETNMDLHGYINS